MNAPHAAEPTPARAPAPPPEAPPPPPAWKLVATLGGAGALAGVLLVAVHDATLPAILAHREAVLRAAVDEVLHAPASVDVYYVVDDALASVAPPDADDPLRVWCGRDAGGAPVGWALDASGPGYQDSIHLLFGYDAAADALLGLRVLQSKETPGLGDRIEKDATFAAGFADAVPPIAGVKPGEASDAHGVDMITGATISSKAVIAAVNAALERTRPLLREVTASGAIPPVASRTTSSGATAGAPDAAGASDASSVPPHEGEP
ncbi:MAG: FMN-binding protein [Planctomycetes bacterium]|nr:FMN-binding protein [Planctomycetota bacterium]